jgi:hypothetical protein
MQIPAKLGVAFYYSTYDATRLFLTFHIPNTSAPRIPNYDLKQHN